MYRYRTAKIGGLLETVVLIGCVIGVMGLAGSGRTKKTRPDDQVFGITVDGLERRYRVYVPTRYNKNMPAPVLIMFHGGGGTARAALWETGWAEKSDEEGFLAVFPEGTRVDPSKPARFVGNPQTWNDGSNRLTVGAVKRHIDDTSFVNGLIDDLIGRFNVDDRRIYATGFSNGASMAFRAGRELSRRLAAIAPVAGNDWSDKATIDRPIPVLYITGTADPLNPIEGGEITIRSGTFGKKPPVRELIQKWVKMLDCHLEPRVVYDKDGVNGLAYSPCREGAEVIFYKIEGMGHTWSGGISILPERIVGKTSDKIKANDLIWEFFEKHPMK
jgi:polyhydroxybutyrate depolymerase